MSHKITIRAVLEGEEDVKGGFKRMSSASSDMSKEIKFLGREIAILGSSVHAVGLLGKQFGILNDEQAKVLTTMGSMMSLSGSVVRALGYLADTSKLVALADTARGYAAAFANAMSSGIHAIAGGIVSALHAIASSSVAVAIAENARAVATAIANSVASWGIGTAVMIAAAAAAAVGIAAYTGAIKLPSLQAGGIVYKPTYALIGEKEPEVVTPLSKMMSWTSKTTSVNVTINEAKTPRETGNAVVDALRRSGVI